MSSYSIRRAIRKDASQFVDLLVALADFEHLDPPDDEARRRIIEDIFSKRWLRMFVAIDQKSKKLAGYALYYYTYSSFLAKRTLYLEDIFVLEKHRRMGIGWNLFLKCVSEAARRDCGRMEWAVLTWNKNAIRFYEKQGAKRLSEWYYYRLTSDKLKELSTADLPEQ
ncbi:MAG TPA: GNAT family N-acetyltransferase [Nitrososphaerales archaeon]|nr:GNAT family N-acetyltransferase [Nitrososphaerales archaeon]